MTVSLAQSERRELCDLMTTLGPDAPTLCTGWTAHHLAAHLRLRETAPLAAAGMFIGPLESVTNKRMARLMSELDFDELVALVAKGPGGLNPMRLKAVDEKVNSLEFFVHHEDLRRGEGLPMPSRMMGPEADDFVWDAAIGLATTRLRRLRIGVVLQRVRAGRPSDEQAAVSTGRNPVTVIGEPGELVLWLYGRHGAAQVQMIGPADSLAKLRSTSLSI